jgi:3-oxoacyl-[acyl-carrier-protein] synthase-1
MIELAVEACGMVSGVGLSAPASCAAIRCGLNNFAETRFMDSVGEWITGSEVPLEMPWRGRAKLARMAAMSIKECVADLHPDDLKGIPLVLCLAEKDRPGRIEGQEEHLIDEIQDLLEFKFDPKLPVISNGRVSGVQAIETAYKFLSTGRYRYCIVAATDTYLTARTLSAHEKANRILTEQNSDGFIPGEAGAAILLTPASRSSRASISINGFGFGTEPASIESGKPLRADGLVQTFKAALSASGLSMGDLDYRITDANGEQYKFKEGDLAVTRLLREHKGEFDIWHPADCIGEVGAATVPSVLAVAEAAARKGYSRGDNVLCHFGNDNGERAAMILICSGSGGA